MSSSPFSLDVVLTPTVDVQNAIATATEAGPAGNPTPVVDPAGNVLNGDTQTFGSGSLQVQVYLAPGSSAEATDVTLTYDPSLGSYVGSSATGPSGWTTLANEYPAGTVALSNFDATLSSPIATSSKGLAATLYFTPVTNVTDFTATLTSGDFTDTSNNFNKPATLPGQLTENLAPLTITGVSSGTTTGTVGTALAGQYGSLILNADGSYTYSVDTANATLTSLPYGQSVTDTFGYTVTDAGGGTHAATLTVTVDAPPCFQAGTRIDTPNGPVAVERLAVGDAVTTLTGEARPIIWIGHRHVDCTRHPRPQTVWPIRIRRGAFGDARPIADLLLSPDHAVYVEDVLIPAKLLVNDITITQEPVSSCDYFHIQLEEHDVVLAEGLPAETLLHEADRGRFDNGGRVMVLHPDFFSRVWEALGCAPLLLTGPVVDAVHARLAERARTVASAGNTPLAATPRRGAR